MGETGWKPVCFDWECTTLHLQREAEGIRTWRGHKNGEGLVGRAVGTIQNEE